MNSDNSQDDYFDTRLGFDKKRKILWSTLWKYFFSKEFSQSDTVLELGAGWCDFINTVDAKRKIAIDLWDGVLTSANHDVEAYVSSATSMSFLESKSINGIFASNLVEHLDRDQFNELLTESSRLLVENGKLLLLQPNYRLCSEKYFDDYTHISIWSDVSLSDYLMSQGWRINKIHPKFLPLTVKSRFPVLPLLIRIYLRSPWKPMAGQMLIIAEAPQRVS